MIIYNVVFVGEMFDAIDTPNHDLESYATMQLARNRVAAALRHFGRRKWQIGCRGHFWTDGWGNYVSITESELITR